MRQTPLPRPPSAISQRFYLAICRRVARARKRSFAVSANEHFGVQQRKKTLPAISARSTWGVQSVSKTASASSLTPCCSPQTFSIVSSWVVCRLPTESSDRLPGRWRRGSLTFFGTPRPIRSGRRCKELRTRDQRCGRGASSSHAGRPSRSGHGGGLSRPVARASASPNGCEGCGAIPRVRCDGCWRHAHRSPFAGRRRALLR